MTTTHTDPAAADNPPTEQHGRFVTCWVYPELPTGEGFSGEPEPWCAMGGSVRLQGSGTGYSPQQALDSLREEIEYQMADHPDSLAWLEEPAAASVLVLPDLHGERFIPILVTTDPDGYAVHIAPPGIFPPCEADTLAEALHAARNAALDLLQRNALDPTLPRPPTFDTPPLVYQVAVTGPAEPEVVAVHAWGTP